MKEKSFKNLKNKIGLKNFFVSKNQQVFKPKNINLKTINIQKYFKLKLNDFIRENLEEVEKNKIKIFDI